MKPPSKASNWRWSIQIDDAKKQLREQCKVVRQTITDSERRASAASVATHLIRSHVFQASSNIACYSSVADELGTGAVITAIWQAGKACYLPVLDTKLRTMHFARYESTTLLSPNCYGILEPDQSTSTFINATLLDMVLLPLLAFDNTGYRLGMGGGYYDRSFAFLADAKRPATPLLIGLGYAAQEVSDVPHDDFDVRLDGVLTEHAMKMVWG